MSIYNTFNDFRPYFFSLREVNEKVCLDVKIPSNWVYDSVLLDYPTITYKIQDSKNKTDLVTFFGNCDETDYFNVFECVKLIIKTNKEIEEKERLFHEKVNELKKLFELETLDKLKEIKLIDNYGHETETGSGVVGEGDEEG